MNVSPKKHIFNPIGECGKGKCPICARNNATLRAHSAIKSTTFQSEGVAPFVGRFGYPNINVGILAPPEPEEEAWLFDAPK